MVEWNGNERSDGVRVECAPVRTITGAESWVVVAPGKFPVLFCPCCGAPMTTRDKAKLVADGVFPPPE